MLILADKPIKIYSVKLEWLISLDTVKLQWNSNAISTLENTMCPDRDICL